jgi:hypothetical protein
MLRGYDIDGVLTAGTVPDNPYVVISGRTFAEYDDVARDLALRAPVYIRGTGAYGDRIAAGEFKATMIGLLGVTEFHEDDEMQAVVIRERAPACAVIGV